MNNIVPRDIPLNFYRGPMIDVRKVRGQTSKVARWELKIALCPLLTHGTNWNTIFGISTVSQACTPCGEPFQGAAPKLYTNPEWSFATKSKKTINFLDPSPSWNVLVESIKHSLTHNCALQGRTAFGKLSCERAPIGPQERIWIACSQARGRFRQGKYRTRMLHSCGGWSVWRSWPVTLHVTLCLVDNNNVSEAEKRL